MASRPPPQRYPELAGSWVEMYNDDGHSVELTSDEEGAASSFQSIPLSAKQAHHLNEALEMDNDDESSIELTSEQESTTLSHQSIPLSTSRSKVPSIPSNMDASNLRSGRASSRTSAVDEATPRKRLAPSSRQKNNQAFVIPKLEHTSSHEDSASTVRATARPRRALPKQASAKSKLKSTQSVAATMWWDLLVPSLAYLLSVVKIVARITKPFVAAALAFWLLAGALIMMRNLLFERVSYALSPICHIPGATSLGLPFCNTTPPHGDAEFDQFTQVQFGLADLVTTSTEMIDLPTNMKNSESSIRDLRVLVHVSSLPSREQLLFEMDGFIKSAAKAHLGLITYRAHVAGIADRTIITNRWTLRELDRIAANAAARESMPTLMKVFYPFLPTPEKTARDLVFEQYMRHSADIEEIITNAMDKSRVLLTELENMESILGYIHEIAARDQITTEDEEDDLLVQLWTKLGGNRSKVSNLQRRLKLLRQANNHRKSAVSYVTATFTKLQEAATELEELRTRVAAPGLASDRGEQSIEYHIEHVMSGVEKLLAVRDDDRAAAMDRYRSIMEPGERLGLEADEDGTKKAAKVTHIPSWQF